MVFRELLGIPVTTPSLEEGESTLGLHPNIEHLVDYFHACRFVSPEFEKDVCPYRTKAISAHKNFTLGTGQDMRMYHDVRGEDVKTIILWGSD